MELSKTIGLMSRQRFEPRSLPEASLHPDSYANPLGPGGSAPLKCDEAKQRKQAGAVAQESHDCNHTLSTTNQLVTYRYYDVMGQQDTDSS
jgi:hypothetical protein